MENIQLIVICSQNLQGDYVEWIYCFGLLIYAFFIKKYLGGENYLWAIFLQVLLETCNFLFELRCNVCNEYKIGENCYSRAETNSWRKHDSITLIFISIRNYYCKVFLFFFTISSPLVSSLITDLFHDPHQKIMEFRGIALHESQTSNSWYISIKKRKKERIKKEFFH